MNSATTQICILGFSGHGLVVAEVLFQSGYAMLWFSDKFEVKINPLDVSYAGNEREESFDWKRFDGYALGIGDNASRKKAGDLVKQKTQNLFTAIHPSAIVASDSIIHCGCFIGAGSIINPQVILEEGVIVNTGAIVEHECSIGKYAHIAPGAVLSGNVTVGKGSFIGANSVVKQGVHIGSEVTVGAGAVVLNDLPNNSTWVGNPAKPLKT